MSVVQISKRLGDKCVLIKVEGKLCISIEGKAVSLTSEDAARLMTLLREYFGNDLYDLGF